MSTRKPEICCTWERRVEQRGVSAEITWRRPDKNATPAGRHWDPAERAGTKSRHNPALLRPPRRGGTVRFSGLEGTARPGNRSNPHPVAGQGRALSRGTVPEP